MHLFDWQEFAKDRLEKITKNHWSDLVEAIIYIAHFNHLSRENLSHFCD